MRWEFLSRVQRRQSGFTLLDSIMVIVIIGIVGMTIIPLFHGLLQESTLNEATAEIVSGIQYAETMAVQYGRPFGFQADAAGRWFKIYDTRYAVDAAVHTDGDPPVTAYGVVLNPLDKSWYLRSLDRGQHYGDVSFTSAQIVFYPDGHSAAADTTITVNLGADRRTITIDGTTGRIRIGGQ